MQRESFLVLDSADRDTVDVFAGGLPRSASRVLAYLTLRVQRSGTTDAASRLLIRVGTELGREQTIAALSELEDRNLVEVTTLETTASGRPPKAWRATADFDDLVARVHRQHAERLLDRSLSFVTDGEPDEPARSEVEADGPLRIALNWHPNGLHAPLFAADAFGWYDDHGVSVSFVPSDGSRAAIERVRSGEADIAVTGAGSLQRADAALAPLAFLYQQAMTVLYTTREAFGDRLTAADQLRHCRVGMPTGTETGLFARLFMSQSGVLSDVEIVDVAGEERDALLAGKVDVVTGVATDPETVEAAGHEVSSLLVADRFPLPGPVLAAPLAAVDADRETLVGLLAGTVGGWVEVTREPEEAAEIVAQRSGASTADERRRIELATDRFSAGEAVDDHGWGWQVDDPWQRLQTALDQSTIADDTP